MNQLKDKSTPFLVGYILAKSALCLLAAFLITAYDLPLLLAALVIFLV